MRFRAYKIYVKVSDMMRKKKGYQCREQHAACVETPLLMIQEAQE